MQYFALPLCRVITARFSFMLILQFDGLFRVAPEDLHLGDNAGFMCYGWVIFRDNMVVARGHGGYIRGKDASSNVAEYLGMIEGLEALLDMQATGERVHISGDAKSIIDQMEGRAAVSASSIKPLYRRARKLARQFSRIVWEWTPRRDNHTADALTRRALRQIHANPQQYEAALQELGAQKNRKRKSARLCPLLDLRMFRTA
jgi:ribonuclease HI